MKFRTNLRSRVTFSFALLGMIISIALAGALYVLTHTMEERLIAETLSAELEDYMARYKLDPDTAPPSSTVIRTYIIDSDHKAAPEKLHGLGSGLHKIQLEGRDYYAEVRISDKQHFIVLYDDEQIEHRENQFKLYLGIGVMVMTLLAALLGFWLAGRVISPVGELAARVSGLRPENHLAPMAEDFPNDEVGRLACEFDAYLKRLAAFIEREQSFTADVSHELRTPLAVIEGAAEILSEDPAVDETTRARVERISRAAHEMGELVSALLILAREEKGHMSETDCAVADLLSQVVNNHQHLVQHKAVELRLDIRAHTILPAECTLLRIVLANLIRNAISFTHQGSVLVSLDENGVTVQDTGIGIPKKQMQRIFERYYTGESGGEGIGLSLVKRICLRNGWHITIESQEEQGTTFRLSF